MAGIAGIAKSRQKTFVRSLLKKIARRGPAGSCVITRPQATLGQVWPQAQADLAVPVEDFSVVLDGEIHNWPELASGATCALEAIETAYHAEGPAFLSKLDGPFAIAIAQADGLFLARDVVGKSPLYCGRRGDALCFASEIKALQRVADDIAEFPPGHYYRERDGHRVFAELAVQPPVTGEAAEIGAELRSRLAAAVRKRLTGNEGGAWLSGGLDSASLTALASRQVPSLHTFATGLEGSDDLAYARAVAEHLGTIHHECICTPDEMLQILPEVIYHLESFDALLLRSSIMNYLVGRLASEHVDSALSGEGGDELFAGYAYLKDLDDSALPDELIDITKRLHNTALQRVDRCSSSHGLVARTAFLDRDVLEYALRIPPEMKIHRNGKPVEKWILRVAMDGLLPREVLERPKAKFWQGAGVGDILAAHADEAISDAEFRREREVSDGIRLNSKEETFYFRIFTEHFGDGLNPSVVGRTKGAPIAA
jgi:asparagine synthase (glutamine-hydrolysing)